jgi:putative endonuclease
VGSAPEAHPPLAENPISGGRTMFYVYVLWSEKICKRYVGCAENIDKRLLQHNTGKNRFTKGGIPWFLIYTEEYSTLSLTRKRELFLKSGIRRKWLGQKFPQYRK